MIAAVTGAPVRPWLAAAVVGDVVDVAATFAAREDVPERVPLKLVGVDRGSAALSAAAYAWVDR